MNKIKKMVANTEIYLTHRIRENIHLYALLDLWLTNLMGKFLNYRVCKELTGNWYFLNKQNII